MMTRAEWEKQIHIICDLGQAPPRMRANFLRDGVAIDAVLREVAAFAKQVASLPLETANAFDTGTTGSSRRTPQCIRYRPRGRGTWKSKIASASTLTWT